MSLLDERKPGMPGGGEVEMTFPQMRRALNLLAEINGEYAGLPMNLEGEQLVVHPKYRFADVVNRVINTEEDDKYKLLTSWRSYSRAGNMCVIMLDKETGKIFGGYSPLDDRLTMTLRTFGMAAAWDIGCEAKAVNKLATLVSHHAFKHYMLTGAFLETSKRSGISYLFRRLKPTVAISTSRGVAEALCGLCLHPIGYYEGTWAGVMVPTDEVVAHLILMRGDEHGYWRQANQHALSNPGCGL